MYISSLLSHQHIDVAKTIWKTKQSDVFFLVPCNNVRLSVLIVIVTVTEVHFFSFKEFSTIQKSSSVPTPYVKSFALQPKTDEIYGLGLGLELEQRKRTGQINATGNTFEWRNDKRAPCSQPWRMKALSVAIVFPLHLPLFLQPLVGLVKKHFIEYTQRKCPQNLCLLLLLHLQAISLWFNDLQSSSYPKASLTPLCVSRLSKPPPSTSLFTPLY